MKVQEAIDRARKLLDDVSKEDWPEDDDLLDWYNESVVTIRSQRADTLLDTDGTYITYVAATNVANDDIIFAEPEKWVIASANYIAFKGFSEDEGDKRDEDRANDRWNSFSNNISML